jgi:hypothetical protein
MRLLIFFLLLLVNTVSHAQLNNFNLEIIKTDETCTNNGSLTFNVTNTTPLAVLQYTVYRYPNLVLPVSVSNINVLGNLSAANYKVVVTQTLNGLSNSQEQDITINHVETPIGYSVTSSNLNCSGGGQINITATSGTIVACEILTGPVTRPLQTSNIFENLPQGTYNIRVFNECGVGDVTTFTLLLNDAPLVISDPEYTTGTSADCNTINLRNTITAPSGTSISYPLTIEYLINQPDGNPPTLITHVVNSGDPASLEIFQDFPLFGNISYNFNLKITDHCNTVYEKTGMIIDPVPAVVYNDVPIACGQKYLTLSVSNHHAPITVNFLAAPFNPVAYNAQHPAPFNDSLIAYGGVGNPVPEGTYIIEVTDACGRTGTVTAEIVYDDPEPSVSGRNNGCFSLFGRINIQIPGRTIVAAIIEEAPAAYSGPTNVSGSIAQGRLILTNMPLGLYVIKVTDECGAEYTVSVEVPPFVERNFTASTVPDCSAGSGSVKIKSLNGDLVQMAIIAAPSGFGTVPADVSSNIDGLGDFYMASLPEGDYVFKGKDICGIERTLPVTVTGYEPDATPFALLAHCGSFDLELSDASPLAEPTYWLQRLNPDTGAWSHPATGNLYTEGTVPTEENSIALSNNATLYNLTYSGNFRIMKSFSSFNNGSENKSCLEVLGEFSYSMDLEIGNAYTLSCNGNPDDVYIEAVNGLQPYTYRITKKDGLPFIINNGNNNIFSNLQPATYDFEVEDACGNLAPSTININTIPSLVEAVNPADMVQCTDSNVLSGHAFNIRDQDAAILNGQSPDLYTVTYYATQADADNAINPLADIYNNAINNQFIYARVVHNLITICHKTVSFRLVVQRNPVLAMQTEYYVCENSTVTLTADAGFDTYTWSTGQTGRSITVTEPGNYSVTVANVHGSVTCTKTVNLVVKPSAMASITEISTEDWTSDRNTITVQAEGAGEYLYSLDGVIYQESNVFDDFARRRLYGFCKR